MILVCGCNQKSPESKENTVTVTEGEYENIWQSNYLGEHEYGAPEYDLYVLLKGEEYLVTSSVYGNFSEPEVSKDMFKDGKIPENLLGMCMFYWAGEGHLFYVQKTDTKTYIVMKGEMWEGDGLYDIDFRRLKDIVVK